jgi:outer membrane usher protein
LLLINPVFAETITAQPTPAQQSAVQELILAVYVNQEDLHETALLLKMGGVLLASGKDIQRWRILLSPKPTPTLTYQGNEYYALQSLSNISYRINEPKQTLLIEAKPDALLPSQLSGSALRLSTPQPSSLGSFVNYDIFAQSSAQQPIRLDSQVELGLFSGWGVGVSNFLGKDISDKARLIRLDTTWTIDNPDQLTSFRIGDAINSAGSWGRPVRFGGLQWATNFQTQPGFITFPMPSIAGEAALPSVVDVYVDNNLLLNREIQPGPFTVNNVPMITGLRDMRMVVRDMLGREQIISQPYYVSPKLLQKNLQDFSYEIGEVRKNYGLDSNGYGRWLAVGTHRLGFSDHFTGEWHTELLQNQQNMGLGSVFLSPSIGVFDIAMAGSHSQKGSGDLLALGFQRQTSGLSFGGRAQVASSQFSQLGWSLDRPAPKFLGSLFIGYSTSGYGSFSLNHIYQEYRDQGNVNLINVSHNLTIGDGWFLSLSAFKSLIDDNNKGVALVLSHTFGERTSGSLTTGIQNDSPSTLMQVQRNLPLGSGLGYRVLTGYDGTGRGTERIESGITLQNDVGTYNVEASRFQEQNNFRGSASGGLAVMGGDAFFSRRLNSSFAVVQVPDYPNVHVYAENQLVATTNASGNALVPALRAYQDNHIRIEQADLPLDAQIDTLTINAAPYFRSGFLLKFPIRRSRGATMKIVLDNGQPLPAGAIVQIIGQPEEFPVALKGNVYITGLAPDNHLRVLWHDQSCQLEVSFPETEEPLPDLGVFTCHGVSP